MEEEDVRGDRGLSVFRLRAVSRLTLVVRCTEIGYSVSTQVLGFRFGCGWCCVVGFLFGCCWFCVLLLCVSAWWNRGIADEVTMASLRLLEGLRHDEIVWLNTYLTGRLRAMPPPAAAAATARASAGPVHADIAADSVDDLPALALAERVGDFNISMDPWEQTGAAPQGWAAHARQTVIPVQGYIQLRPQDTNF